MGQVRWYLYEKRFLSLQVRINNNRLLEPEELRNLSDCKSHKDKNGSLVNPATEFEVYEYEYEYLHHFHFNKI